MLDVRMSPQAALWLMGQVGAAHLEASVLVGTPAGYVAVTPQTAPDGPSAPFGPGPGDVTGAPF